MRVDSNYPHEPNRHPVHHPLRAPPDQGRPSGDARGCLVVFGRSATCWSMTARLARSDDALTLTKAGACRLLGFSQRLFEQLCPVRSGPGGRYSRELLLAWRDLAYHEDPGGHVTHEAVLAFLKRRRGEEVPSPVPAPANDAPSAQTKPELSEIDRALARASADLRRRAQNGSRGRAA